MLSSCSNGSLSQEMSVCSMWTDATQILSVAMAHRKRAGIMRRRMVMLSEVDWRGRAEIEFLSLARSGLNLSWRRVETNFLRCARKWLLGHFFVHSLPSDVLPIGDTEPTPNPIDILTSYRLTQADILNSIRGYHRTWEDLEIPVSLVRRLTTAHGPSLRDATPRARASDGRLEDAPISQLYLGSWLMFSRTTKVIDLIRPYSYW